MPSYQCWAHGDHGNSLVTAPPPVHLLYLSSEEPYLMSMPLLMSNIDISAFLPLHSDAKLVFVGNLLLLALFACVLLSHASPSIRQLQDCRKGYFLWHSLTVNHEPSNPSPIPNVNLLGKDVESCDIHSDSSSMTNGGIIRNFITSSTGGQISVIKQC